MNTNKKNINYNVVLMFIVFFITSCAYKKYYHQPWVPENQNNNAFQAIGRINIQYHNKGYYSNFELSKLHVSLIAMKLNSPLGNTLGEICADVDGIVFSDYKNNVLKYSSSINEITFKMIGYEVPLNNLPLWIVGQYSTLSSFQLLSNNELIQDGWKIIRYVDQNHNPSYMQLSKDELTIKIIFDKFNKIESLPTTINTCKELTDLNSK